MNIALILSGGTGTRMGLDTPKQYIKVNNRPIIAYCIETLSRHHEIDAIQIVAEMQWHDFIKEYLVKFDLEKKFRGFSSPGANRQLSIFNGLKDISRYAGEDDYVMIHDAARPMLTMEMISGCFKEVKGHHGVLPVLPMKDTVYFSEDGTKVSELLDRSRIYAGQAPEVFVLGKYMDANEKLLPDKILEINGSTEPAIMAEMDIVMIPGDEANYKITTMSDLSRFRGYMEQNGE